MKTRQTRQYLFALLLFLTLIFMSLYEFYFNIVERAKTGQTETSVLEAILCQNHSELDQLRNKIEELNEVQDIRNFDGHHITDQTIVVVIQVHERVTYLQALIQSLSSVIGINSTILIFSHDHFSDEINKLVQTIEFAPVMQIFFPYSIQLYPNEFPGTSPKDCPWDIGVEEAHVRKCVGANSPDQYGHYRQGETTQAKHHWWWKINRVFEELNITKNFGGYVLFLEEDHYLTPDALHVLRLMIDLTADQCPQCNSFNIGTFKQPSSYEDQANKVEIAEWNNLGYAFNRSVWQALHACSSVFCTFDDYNWDWSLQYTVQECFSQKLVPLVVESSRVFHVGQCGMHHNKNEKCQLRESLVKTKGYVDSVKSFLFPTRLTVESTKFHQSEVKKGWGGWSDPRDIQLCLNISYRENVT